MRFSSELTLSAKTCAFVGITHQTFCSYAVAFLFSKARKLFLFLWLFRPTQKHIFSFMIFHFSVKNWNYCGASIKKTGRNAKHMILWLGLNNISEVQRSLPNPTYEENRSKMNVFSNVVVSNNSGLKWIDLNSHGTGLAPSKISFFCFECLCNLSTGYTSA